MRLKRELASGEDRFPSAAPILSCRLPWLTGRGCWDWYLSLNRCLRGLGASWRVLRSGGMCHAIQQNGCGPICDAPRLCQIFWTVAKMILAYD